MDQLSSGASRLAPRLIPPLGERDPAAAERELRVFLADYERAGDGPPPTSAEVLEVLGLLGYIRPDPGDDDTA